MDAGVDLPMVAFGVNPIGTKAVIGSWGLRNARPLALHRKEHPPRAPLHEQRKKATLNVAHGR